MCCFQSLLNVDEREASLSVVSTYTDERVSKLEEM